MSSKKSSGDGITTPDDIINSYLDDLLGSEDPLGIALGATDVQLTPIAANAGPARVVPLPTKKTLDKAAEKHQDSEGKLPLRPDLSRVSAKPKMVAPKAVEELKPSFVEPAQLQTQEQKLKLEKLLQSARTQLLADASVITPAKVETQPRFVDNPDEIQDWVIETTLATPESPPEVTQDLQAIHYQQPIHYQLDGVQWLENGRPQWAQSRFDVLLFQVSGLTLAVPLIALGQIQPLTGELTPLFGQADWFMGLQPTAAGKIRTVNTAKFVMPERYDDSFLETARYVVSINGVPWGLAVDSVNQPITLEPEDVKWRGDRSKRPWLAGTVKDHMCALLDIPRIGQMLIEADKNFIPA